MSDMSSDLSHVLTTSHMAYGLWHVLQSKQHSTVCAVQHGSAYKEESEPMADSSQWSVWPMVYDLW